MLGHDWEDAEGVALREILTERGLTPRHAQDLLAAFRLDVTKRRYRDWDELMHYCSLSAMPVGRYVLDVHGEDRATWAASDAICAALQVINHLQDCKADYNNLDRVYIPLEALTATGAAVEDIGRPTASPALRASLRALAERTAGLLDEGDPLPDQISDLRLSLEISVIHTLARHLVRLLLDRDPLNEKVHLGKLGFAVIGMIGILKGLSRRLARRAPFSAEHKGA